MCAALIGGMDRLKRDYINTAKADGVKLKVFTGKENKVSCQIGNCGLIIVFTNKVSHKARKDVAAHAKAKGIPMKMLHSCGISSLRDALAGNA
ncbi:MAG: DUF2325 domain-containing protein [Desulfovibrionaceae bacterium]